MKVSVVFERIIFVSLELKSSTFGDFSATHLKENISKGYKIIQPSLNAWMAKKVWHLPKKIIGIYELK